MKKIFKTLGIVALPIAGFLAGAKFGFDQGLEAVPAYNGVFKKMNGDEVVWEAPATATLRWASGQYEIKYKDNDGDNAYTPIDPSFGDMCAVTVGSPEKLICWNENREATAQNFTFEGTVVSPY
jgi:hypothetical protein